MKTQPIACLLVLACLWSPLMAETTYFSEDFEGPNAKAPTVWYQKGESKLTEERAHSGKKSAWIQGGTAYFEIPLSKPLKWDRTAPDGIGNQPLYLSAWVYCVSGGGDARLGLRCSIVPRHHPGSGGAPLTDEIEANVAGRTNQWLHLCLDVGKLLRQTEAKGHLNADWVVFESVSLINFSGGTFYLDDIRLSTEQPKACAPPPALPDPHAAAAYYRSDPKLEGMILDGVYGGIGSFLGDMELHPWIVRDLKRHYINCAIGCDYRVTSPEPILQAVDQVLDQAAFYDFPLMLCSYIGDKYTEEAAAWPDEKLHGEMVKVVRRFKNKSHLLAWYLEEESDWMRTKHYLQQKRWVETEDPNHSCLTTFGNGGTGVEAMGQAHALLATDNYPIQGVNANPWHVPRRIGLDVRHFHQPNVLTDQIFSGEGYTMPTPGQWRLMAYGSLAEGVKGFFHFLYSPQLVYQLKMANPINEGMVDPYGTSGKIYEEIQQQLGPALFSFGELLKTCNVAEVPSGLSVECKTVEDAQERPIAALALRRHEDKKNGYDILAVYSNDPVQAQSGVLSLSKAWLKGRVVMDLDAHAQRITEQQPILVNGERVELNLPPGGARFFAVTAKEKTASLLERMWTRRLEAVRKMVEFDNQWLEKVGVRKSPVEPPDHKMPALSKLEHYLTLDQENQTLIAQSPLGEVVKNLAQARRQLSAAYGSISQWAHYTEGKPFPPEIAPGKSYCDMQDKLGELFVGCSDLAYQKPPGELLNLTAELAALTRLQADRLKTASAQGSPTEAGAVPPDRVQALAEKLHQAGWTKPPTTTELFNPAGQTEKTAKQPSNT